jgi:hypothetical protein
MNDYKVDFKLDEDVMLFSVSGELPDGKLEQPENVFQRLIDACLACQRNKLLIDARELQARFTTVQVFRAGKDAVSLATAGIRLAIVTRPDLRDPFFEDVVVNRGGQARVFMDMDAARRWLGKFPPGAPNSTLPHLAAEPVRSRNWACE